MRTKDKQARAAFKHGTRRWLFMQVGSTLVEFLAIVAVEECT